MEIALRTTRIEDYLNEIDESQQPVFFRELLALDLTYRRRLGEEPKLGDYQSRFKQPHQDH